MTSRPFERFDAIFCGNPEVLCISRIVKVFLLVLLPKAVSHLQTFSNLVNFYSCESIFDEKIVLFEYTLRKLLIDISGISIILSVLVIIQISRFFCGRPRH